MLETFYWVIILLLVLSALGGFAWPEPSRAHFRHASFVLVVIELIIVGLKVFGFK